MTRVFESETFVSPMQVKKDIETRFKEVRGIKSVELKFNGDGLEDAKQFAGMLVSLQKQGVKVSHEFSIKLDFPNAISRQKTLLLMESLPKPVRGTVRARLEILNSAGSPAETKS
ncbi:MAG: hypothetical protein HYZ87_04830 [Candidatus Omnitrophica bacterium]|nr:hypothetical protein [Candidatus Omnitrophota bacterium]